MTVFGYARVSTADQHLTGQIEALKAAGATTIYREKISGVRAERPQLAKLMAALKPSDVVLVTKLDRLDRSTRELLDLIDSIGKAGAVFRSLGDPLWDTSSPQGRLLSTLLAAIAEFERERSASALARAAGGQWRMASNLAASPSSRPISGLRPSSGVLQAKPWHRSRGATRSISR